MRYFRNTISLEEANRRLHEKIECYDLIEYNGMSKPCKIQCRNCGKILSFANVYSAISSMSNYCYSCNYFNNLSDIEKQIREIKQLKWIISDNQVEINKLLEKNNKLKEQLGTLEDNFQLEHGKTVEEMIIELRNK